MSYNADAQVFETQIVVTNTTQPAGVTSGSIINRGSLSTYDTYVTGHTVINNVKITPNLNDIIYEQQATLNNSQNSWADITDFYFDDSVCNSFKAFINVTVSSGSDKYAVWELSGLYKPSGWVITSTFSGDLTGVQFSITNKEGGVGQIQYQNSNTSGTTYIRYRANTTAPPGSTPLGASSGVINNTSGPFIPDSLVYASNSNTLATTDLSYVSNVLKVGGSSRFVAEKTSSFVNFSNGGALTSMGDASIAKKLIIGEKIGVANTSPTYSLDVTGDINFTGTFYKNGNVYSGSEIWATNSSSVFYTAGNVGLGTSSPSHQLDVVGGIRSSAGLTTTTLVSTSVTSGSVSSTNLVGTNATIGSGLFSNANVTTGTIGALVSSNANVTTGTVGTLVGSTATITNASMTTGTVGTLLSSNANVTTGTIGTLVGSNANVTTGTIGTLVGSTADVTTGTIGTLVGSSARITNVVSTTISSGTLVGTTFTGGSMSLSGDLIIGGTLTTVNITTTNVVDTHITSGNINVTSLATILNANITTGTIGNFVATSNTLTNVLATNISSGTLNLSTGITSASAQITNSNVTTETIGTARITTSLMALGNSNTIGSIITNSGNVGFGTSSPSDLVHLYTATVGANMGQIFQTGSRQYRMGIRGDISNSFVIQDDTAAQAYFAINTAGNLTVSGDITAFGSISDRRFKENIQNITTDVALDKVKSLRPVTFTWKSNISNLSKIGTDDAGFIAQEVEEVVEYAVGEFSDLTSGEVYKKINHERIIPYLVGAIQKLEARISELEGKL